MLLAARRDDARLFSECQPVVMTRGYFLNVSPYKHRPITHITSINIPFILLIVNC